MKKYGLLLAFSIAISLGYGQEEKKLKFNEETGLIEATYYHANGQISQEGTFNKDRKLHGQWISYNEQGEKIALGSYDNGLKTGKWFFYADNTLKEVEYSKNAIASVTEAKNSEGIVNQN